MTFFSYLRIIPFFFTVTCLSQTDNVGSGRAIQLDGVDDRVDVGDHYHDLNLPFTISAWVNPSLDPDRGMPIFVTNDNNPTYRGFWFVISQSAMLCEFGDGTGGNNSVFRKGKSASVSIPNNVWSYVTAVMQSPTDVRLYLNGFNVGGSSSGGSSLSMASSYPGDIAKIGYFFSNSVTYTGEGTIDEVRLWNRALTESEIRQTMCMKLAGNETGLIGYWTFDEVSGNAVFDKSTNQFHGSLVGNPQRVYSGAPIGDASAYSYKTSWTNESLSLSGGGKTLTASSITGSPWGVHIYRVDAYPSQSGGLTVADVQIPYFGVFLARATVGGGFSANFDTPSTCPIYARTDNSMANWTQNGSATFTYRTELVKVIAGSPPVANLGPDEIVCNSTLKTLNPVSDPANKTFLWSTGATSSTIDVTATGTYWVNVIQNCQIDKDTIDVVMLQTPLAFSLGEDIITCEGINRELTISNPNDDEIEWSTGSDQSTIHITEPGEYWIELRNVCGMARDTVTITQLVLEVDKIPNVITPNGDDKNEFFVVEKPMEGSSLIIYDRWGKLVFESPAYKNNWNGSGLSAGVYYWRAEGTCIKEAKGSISIVR